MDFKRMSLTKIKEELFKTGWIISAWHLDDIKLCAENYNREELSYDDCRVIMKEIEKSHDAEIGINWESILVCIDNFLTKKKENFNGNTI